MDFVLDLAGIRPVSKEPYPFTPLQLSWLNALEKGGYKQGQGALCGADNHYCCLGVLAELSGAQRQFVPSRHAYRFSLPDECPYSGGTGLLTYAIRKLAFLKSDMGDFANPVAFPGLDYGNPQARELAKISSMSVPPPGHTSLASMNDVRMLPKGDKWRAFTFKEIAAYIRHDPWNVLNAPEGSAQAAFIMPPLVEGGIEAHAQA